MTLDGRQGNLDDMPLTYTHPPAVATNVPPLARDVEFGDLWQCVDPKRVPEPGANGNVQQPPRKRGLKPWQKLVLLAVLAGTVRFEDAGRTARSAARMTGSGAAVFRIIDRPLPSSADPMGEPS